VRLMAMTLLVLGAAGCILPMPAKEENLYKAAQELEKAHAYEQALDFYREYLKLFPGSVKSDAILLRVFGIALGHSGTAWGHYSLKELIEDFPAGPQSAESIFRLGEYEFEHREYEDAIATFRALITDYPESERVEGAIFLSGESELGQYRGADYDYSPLRASKTYYELLLRRYPSGAYVQRALERLQFLERESARRDYLMALYYSRHAKPRSARYYLECIAREHPQSQYAELAKEILHVPKTPEKSE
jgi:outer membrane protein assembly factor BamD (BamD/ComL family)